MASFATEGEGAADLFHRPDFWKSSNLLNPPPPLAEKFFDLLQSRFVNSDASAATNDSYFRPPPGLGPDATVERRPSETHDSVFDASGIVSEAEPDRDLWLVDDNVQAQTPVHKSWVRFETGQQQSDLAIFLSEADASAYDAFLASGRIHEGSIPQGLYKNIDLRSWMSCLLSMSLGRDSFMFAWNQDTMTFLPLLGLTKVPCYSGESLAGIVRLCTSCGETYRRLKAFVERTYSSNATPSRIALANALDKLLLVVQDELGARGLRAKSILQLQSFVKPVLTILSYFQQLIHKSRKTTNDSSLLSIIYAEAQSAELSEPFLKDAMGEILRMVSRPFMEFVEEWLGLRPERGVPISKSGSSKGFVRCDKHMWIDDQGFELEEEDFFLDLNNIPSFIPDDMARAIFETGKNLRFLQSYHPQHPLACLNSMAVAGLPNLEWQYDWASVRRVERKADEYHRAVAEILCKSPVTTPKTSSSMANDLQRSDEAVLQFFGKDELRLEQTVLASIEQLDRPVTKVQSWDKLSALLRNELFSLRDEGEVLGSNFSPHWSLLPMLSFGPMIYAQARLVNRECLRSLYVEHNLRQHIRLQKAFQLLGDGMFSSRLSNALFNPEMEKTERQAGVARSGANMGLRLSNRVKWPPASSELRLALAGLLTDSYQQSSDGTGWEGVTLSRTEPAVLPGGLSFAIRELSPEEMDGCMDPGALEALDFLRLSYKPPPPLTPILTPGVLVKYDRIFKHLLRLLRMLCVTDQLFRDMTSSASKWKDPDDVSLRFRLEAHNFISNVARFFFDVGIEKPWRGFEAWLDTIEQGLGVNKDNTKAPSAISPDRLGEQHERTLDEIMAALLLRKRQQPVLKLLEEVFMLVLSFSKIIRVRAENAFGPRPDVKELYGSFREKVEVFITVCRGMSEKTGYGQKREAGKTEENHITMLLLMLDMSNYYVKR
ncbi:Spc98 family-domain-containing protein [Coniella lustricola]|uniref:Spindle pole body component n=1 Tax=Coniella lustricola TaxID=2025994 RepID=A0A2T3AKM2_9PEZI|nr:Spc98 family-domain-containing protein [Coniella lustricola]